MIQAKMKCSSVQKPYPEVEYVTLHAVYSSDPESPNYSFSRATPSAALSITLTNPKALGRFVEGNEYLIDFRDA